MENNTTPANKTDKIFLLEIALVILFILFYVFIFYFLNILNIRSKFSLFDFIPTLQKNYNNSSNTIINVSPTPSDTFKYDSNLAKKYLTADLVDYLQPKYFPLTMNIKQSLENNEQIALQKNFFGLVWISNSANFYGAFNFNVKSNIPDKTLIFVASPSVTTNVDSYFYKYFNTKLSFDCKKTTKFNICNAGEILANKDIIQVAISILPNSTSMTFCHAYKGGLSQLSGRCF